MGSSVYNNASNLGWVVQKFGGTSVGKFPEKVRRSDLGHLNKSFLDLTKANRGYRLPVILSSRCFKRAIVAVNALSASNKPYRASLSQNRVVVVCSARSTGKKAEGTTSRSVSDHPHFCCTSITLLTRPYRLLAVFNKLKKVGVAYATSSEEDQLELIESAKGLIMDICNDHVFAAEAFVKDPSLKQSLARKIEAECHELVEYIVAAKRFNLEINARSKDRVISFGERLACLYMTVLLQDAVSW